MLLSPFVVYARSVGAYFDCLICILALIGRQVRFNRLQGPGCDNVLAENSEESWWFELGEMARVRVEVVCAASESQCCCSFSMIQTKEHSFPTNRSNCPLRRSNALTITENE